MNPPRHYPDEIRCIKLTSIGFPKTHDSFTRIVELPGFEESVTGEIVEQLKEETYLLPSVMELLDVIPKSSYLEIIYVPARGINIDFITTGYTCRVKGDTLPNALCDLVIWLHDNGYITFNK